MPGTIICVRFDETALAGLDALCGELGSVTRSWAIRHAVSRRLMQSALKRFDTAKPTVYDTVRSVEPGAVPPPAASGLPVPDSDEVTEIHNARLPPQGILRSRSVQHRIAAQKGEPVPEFDIPVGRGGRPCPDCGAEHPSGWECRLPLAPTIPQTEPLRQVPEVTEFRNRRAVVDGKSVVIAEEFRVPNYEAETQDMTPDELDAWMVKVMKP